MKNYTRENRPWVIWLTIIAVIMATVGVFFYYTLLRQSKTELIEAIPTDATFIFTINDNDAFVRDTKSVTPYLNEIFLLDALPAYETMRGKLPVGEYDLTISGHTENDGISILFNTHADKAAFKRLLRALSIDPNNYTAFENNRIYTYGTNFKSVKFVYTNHIISFSTDVELLKRAIVQHSHPKNLLSDKQFKEMYNLTEKNRKQNWLIIHPQKYLPYLTTFLKEEISQKLFGCLDKSSWTALQLRFSANDMYLSGYMFAENPNHEDFDILTNRNGNEMEITDLYPSQIAWYAHLETPRVRELQKLKKQTAEGNILANLNPAEIGYFSLTLDSTDYKFAIMLPDSNHNVLEALFGEKSDSIRTANPDGIYPTPSNILPLLKLFAPDSVACVMERGKALVFAPSKDAMKGYQNCLKATGTLSQNRYYPFVNDAVASSSILNFVLFNNETLTYWPAQLSDKGNASHFGKELRIFSLSCDAMEKGQHLVPVNLYLHF